MSSPREKHLLLPPLLPEFQPFFVSLQQHHFKFCPSFFSLFKMSSQSPDVNLYPVTAIRVVIHTTGKFFEGDTCSGNHASIYLLVTGGSVHINMKKAQAHHTHGTLEVKTHNYQVSRSTLRSWDLTPSTELTVGHVLAYVSCRRGFNLSRSGKGCRYWM